MGRYDNMEDGYSQGNMRQKDLVLSTNEFVFIQSKTNGQIKTYTGPIMVTISAQESMVVFNSKTKRFEETGDFEKARQIFTSAPEGWYVVLKNPAKDGTHPDAAKAMNSPELNIGKKINVAGPCSFSLYPGQMAKVIQGHRLRSNQYLIARVYDADAASKSVATIVDAEGKEVETTTAKYFVGQLLVIKGTEVSFYMPPTGIEVIADNGEYVRDAVTLERLEYVILKDESGSKRYVSGPSVVFPEPTETFVESNNKRGGVIFRALELSPISGIYVKVIADYVENEIEHKTGEELFITGNDQMIYYPRPEHALIQYDGKYMHHAIAIPEGEGRYVLNRLTGEIKTVTGPAMYLPDPRTEVVVKRKLSKRECELFYPGNREVLEYNQGLSEIATEKLARSGKANAITDAINCAYSTANATDSLAIFEATANISRGVSYTKPRTITLDTKYDGVVSIDVWTGYAVCVVSKSGKREVVVGPATRLLNYDETLQPISTSEGDTVFLKLNNNKITDVINAQTSDYVDVQVKLTYNVDFNGDKSKWFEVDNYTRFVTDYMRNAIKIAIKDYDIQNFYADSTAIIRTEVLDEETGVHTFKNNGAVITDVEVVSVSVERSVAELLEQHQEEILSKSLELADADAKMQVVTALAEVEKKEADLAAANKLYKLELDQKFKEEQLSKEEAIKTKLRAAAEAENKAKADMQEVLAAINDATIAREKAQRDAEIEYQKSLAKIEEDKQKAYAATVVEMLGAIQPGLIEAINANTQTELVSGIGSAISPYAMANGESVADTVSTLLRGSKLEDALKNFMPPKSE